MGYNSVTDKTGLSLVIVASQNCELMRKSDKIWPYSSSRSSKVIDFWCQKKAHMWLLISH